MSAGGRRRAAPLWIAAWLAAACIFAAAPASARPPVSTGAPAAAAAAEPVARMAPPSDAFERYLERREERLPAPRWPAAGVRPAPIDLSHLSGTFTPAATGSALPSSYDLRALGRLGPVDDQGTYGTCWALAALDSLESALLPSDPQDFSEDNLELTSGFDGEPYQTGGNALEAVAYLARWAGPVTEAEDPYGDAATPRGTLPVKHVQDVIFLPPRSGALDNTGIKQAVVDFGAVYTAMYFGGADAAYYDETTHAYYCWGDEPFDHAVTIVGWDDDFSRDRFLEGHEPPGDGAYLVRNSWGTSFGDDGYFWVSYYDTCIGSRLAPAGTSKANSDVTTVVAGVEPAGGYADVYQHDPLGWTDSLGFGGDAAWWAASYVARSADPLVAMSFYTAAPGSSYQVYAGLGGTADLSFLQAGGEPLPGYHTVRLEAPFSLVEGQRFTVAVRLVTPGYAFPVPLETNIDGYSSKAGAGAGEGYVSPDGSAWMDVTSLPDQRFTSVCLKAFTRPEGPADLAAPVTTAAGPSSEWRRTPMTLTFGATDGDRGSGFAFTQYMIGATDWRTGEKAVVPAPSSHANDGVHVVLYRSVDVAGNVETVRSRTARIDTRPPAVRTPRPCVVRRGARATMRFEPRDARPSRGSCQVVVRVKTRSGRLVLTFKPSRWYPCGELGGYRFRCPGSLTSGDYRFWLTARDGAGNRSKPVAGRLAVR